MFVACAGYTGWYFGHIDGYSEAKAQFERHRPTRKKPSIKPSYSRTKAKRKPRSIRRAPTKATVTKRLPKQQKKYSPPVVKERTVICRWTVGRLDELERIIKTGGRGKKSAWCKNYKERLDELRINSCSTSRNSFSGTC